MLDLGKDKEKKGGLRRNYIKERDRHYTEDTAGAEARYGGT